MFATFNAKSLSTHYAVFAKLGDFTANYQILSSKSKKFRFPVAIVAIIAEKKSRGIDLVKAGAQQGHRQGPKVPVSRVSAASSLGGAASEAGSEPLLETLLVASINASTARIPARGARPRASARSAPRKSVSL